MPLSWLPRTKVGSKEIHWRRRDKCEKLIGRRHPSFFSSLSCLRYLGRKERDKLVLEPPTSSSNSKSSNSKQPGRLSLWTICDVLVQDLVQHEAAGSFQLPYLQDTDSVYCTYGRIFYVHGTSVSKGVCNTLRSWTWWLLKATTVCTCFMNPARNGALGHAARPKIRPTKRFSIPMGQAPLCLEITKVLNKKPPRK